MSEFYILSLKYSGGEPVFVWWGPNSCGYERSLDRAGRYTKQQVEGDPSYFNNGESTLAVPVEVVDGLAARMVASGANLAEMVAAAPPVVSRWQPANRGAQQ